MNMIVRGAGGGGKGGGGGGAQEAPNTLRSNMRARLVELLGEGPIHGWATDNPAKSVYFDKTPLMSADGSLNFSGVSLDFRQGLPDQEALAGSTFVSIPHSVETQVKASITPIRTITDAEIDAVRVVVRLPALALQDNETGDIKAASVAYVVEYRVSGGGWTAAETVNIVNQKTTSPYQRATYVSLPPGGAPWDIRVRRLTPDAANVNLQNETWWESYTELVHGKFIYPNSALWQIVADAQQFGSSLPARAYHIKGLITSVPSNYDAETRTYTGIWDGTFKQSWHSNPAWVFWDLLTNNRYGLGEFITPATADKWTIYQIGRYCDELVPSGFSDPDGNPIMEPRFTFNGVINTREEAYKVLQNIAAAFRGMAYWSLGQVFASADMPQDPLMIITPANVIDGEFKYSRTALKARHSVALVTWNDPDDFFQPAVEVVQNDDMLVRYGWRETAVQKMGCRSRGEAHRYGRWILDTEQNETETVEFTMSWKGFVTSNGQTLKPGDIVVIADERKNGGVRCGGWLRQAITTSRLVLDAPFDLIEGETYSITVHMPDGSIAKRTILAFDEAKTEATLSTPLPALPDVNALWVIEGASELVGRRFRIMAVQEQEEHLFKITALQSDPTKYARVEQNLKLDPIRYQRPSNTIKQVENVTHSEARYFQNGVSHSRVTLSWSAPSDFLANEFVVTADSPRGFRNLGRTNTTSIDINDAAGGEWTFYISAISRVGATSVPVPYTATIEGWDAVDGPIVDELVLQGGGTQFTGRAPTITWVNTFPEGEVVYQPENVVRVYDVLNNLLRTEIVKGNSYTYGFEQNVNDGGPRRALRFDVTVKSVVGVESDPASITVENPKPAIVVPTLQGAVGSLTVTYTPPADADFAGAMIWMSKVAGFDPTILSPAYDGPDTKVDLFGNAGTYYVRIAVYDAFGKDGLNISPQYSITVTDVDTVIAEVAPALEAAKNAAGLNDLDDLADVVAQTIADAMLERDETDATVQKHRDLLSVQVGNLSAEVMTEREARVTADYAEASARSLLQVYVNETVTAAILDEQIVRAQADLAEAEARLALQATLNSNIAAAILEEQTARATADGALSSSISTVQTTVNGHTSSLSTIQSSVNGVQLQFGVIGTIDGVTGGFLFTGVRKLDGSVSYSLQIQGNVIVNGSITAAKLAVNTLSAISADIGTVTAGVAQSADGKMMANFTGGYILIAD